MSKTNDYTALGPLVGFVYQIYYFLYRLLTIQDGETVSLEKIDDAGVETGEKKTYVKVDLWPTSIATRQNQSELCSVLAAPSVLVCFTKPVP